MYPDVGVVLNVHRVPYSFLGDAQQGAGHKAALAGFETPEGEEPTWHESLLGYCGGEAQRAQAEQTMLECGRRAGVELDYGVQTNWQPVDSQRLMLWASQFGKAEDFIEELGLMHFSQRKSASHTATLVEAATKAGLPRSEVEAFLRTNEGKDEVWQSYHDTIHKHDIRAIPLFVFGLEDMGGPFRPTHSGQALVINGSADPPTFFRVLQTLYGKAVQADLLTDNATGAAAAE